ncbi:4Fe-4S dicluster domain-containing protein [Dethiosulfovibrio salsuginis]|uniref:[FeFe] hydrogenase, group B1/B3 n=1 Tax=Dethiosulfovibrio salsuginis TaxID=561720 RepID=A0A1X7IMK9_9BACT|nr:4Fe-4S dicluster domain-containing protein [Dethiosulfovibrio salsuginis]SMG15925.1 [FeFe] hydrogenase, group B1/B3 [Dethiosulfovibrio salsuginis]
MENVLRCDNEATRFRREVLVRIASMCFNDNLEKEVDRIPYIMRPKGDESTRCCIYRDREVLKHRCMAAMGHRLEDEEDDFTPLSRYASMAMEREKPEGPVLTVIDLACSACVKSRYMVTDACRGCVARPCTLKCPKKAIVQRKGQAVIDHDACIACGICMKVCPYHAIIRIPIPCEEACPVDAIYKDEMGKEHIDPDKCIACGKCVLACPFGAVVERSQIVDVIKALKGDRPVIAMAAPAISGQFPGDTSKVVGALKELGFAEVAEVAKGADETARLEALELEESISEGKLLTTSCCPAYVAAARKHLPDLAKFVSHTPSPMKITAKWVKDNYPDSVTVFIGPCTAKRMEAMEDDDTDYVLTFEELGALFVAARINVNTVEPGDFIDDAGAGGRGFPISGGVTQAVKDLLPPDLEVKPLAIDGLDRGAMKTLKLYGSGKCPGNFLEVMACQGGCVSGAGVIASPTVSKRKVTELSQKATAKG